MKRLLGNGLVGLVLLLSVSAKAQHQELTEKAVMYKRKTKHYFRYNVFITCF